MSYVKAFIRQVGRGVNQDEIWYVATDNDNEIIDAPVDDLVFAPDVGDKQLTREDAEFLFREKYPAKLPYINRVSVVSNNGYRSNRHLVHGNVVKILPEDFVTYAGQTLEHAVLLARKLGGYVPIATQHWTRDALEAAGCYIRHSNERGQRELVYNPKMVARQVARRKEKEKAGPAGRGDGYIMVHEFANVNNTIARYLEEYILIGYFRVADNYRRANVVENMLRWVTLFNLIFGANAHRQIPEFQQFLALWRKTHLPTKKAFKSCESNFTSDLFHWLDSEAKVKKPRKRKLKMLPVTTGMPLAPVCSLGVKEYEFGVVSRAVGSRISVWLEGKPLPLRGVLHDVNSRYLLVGKKEHMCYWGDIKKIRTYTQYGHPNVRNICVREEEEDDT